MKILIVHNHYLQSGGEDEVVETEKRMLEHYGHTVILYKRGNSEINEFPFLKKCKFALYDVYWSRRTYDEICHLIDKEKPDVTHIHNILFLISPSVYDACYDKSIPVVQTLHNYRAFCPIGTFFRKNKVCEDCLQYGKLAAILHRCWRKSFLASMVLVKIISCMEKNEVYKKKITRFIALNQFSRKKFVGNGFDSEKIAIKPNFIDFDPGVDTQRGGYGIYIGALREYKGVMTLIDAWRKLKKPFKLKMIGGGPLYKEIQEKIKGFPIELVGQLPIKETVEYLKHANFIIIPSECYETGPRVSIEAFSCGVPIIASNIGALADAVEEGTTGVLFKGGDVRELVEKINYFIENSHLVEEMGKNARSVFESKYSVEENYRELMEVYNQAIQIVVNK